MDPEMNLEPGAPAARREAPAPSRSGPGIGSVRATAYRIPTDGPESDGTLEWDATTLVVVEVGAGGHTGIGYTYSDAAAARVAREKLATAIEGQDAFDIPGASKAMIAAVRNIGRRGIGAAAISAADAALWDLKGKLLDVPLAELLGRVRDRVPLYGSGGFTSYSTRRLADQLGGWASEGFARVKMKVGRAPDEDPGRVRLARDAIGPGVELFVDANGAYTRKQAWALADVFAGLGVRWFEEPVSSDDLEGLHLLRGHVPPPMQIAAGEYGYEPHYFRRMLESGAVDVIQADASRCGGISGFLRVDALAEAFSIPLSAHCAPTIHCAAGCAAQRLVHLEYFHDHVRIEQMLFDGAPRARAGELAPDLSRPGLGIELKRPDAAQFEIGDA